MTRRLFPVPLPGPGALWMLPCPFEQDYDALTEAGVDTVLSLLEPDEAARLGAGDGPALAAARGITHLSFPIADYSTPQMPAFETLIDDLVTRLADGAHLAVHCRAGIGRSGLLACCLCVARGDSAEQAMARVSAARGCVVPETETQRTFIADYAARQPCA